MLTRAQLERIARRHRIGLQAQERDYFQHLLLYLLYTAPRREHVGLYFKGGTALRLVYGSARFSEDLDFNSDLDSATTRARFDAAVNDLPAFGVKGILRNQRSTAATWGCDLSYEGPLFDGRSVTKGKVRVDASLRREKVDVVRPLVTPEYDDVDPFTLSALSLEHIFAEKVRALFVRAKPRDLYDVWFLLQKGVTADRTLVNEKLSLYQISFSKAKLKAVTATVQKDWERDLNPLLGALPDFADVRTAVLANLR